MAMHGPSSSEPNERMSWKSRLIGLAGLSANDVYLMRSVRHTAWRWRSMLPGHGGIPLRSFSFDPPREVSAEDLALAERLIAAYHLAADGGANRRVSPMWQENLDTKQRTLRQAVDARDPNGLAGILAVMLRREVVHGIDSGDLYTGRNWRIHSLKLLDDLVSLAEYLGVVRAYSGQGTVTHAFDDGIEQLVARIETRLGMSIGVPEGGAPFGIRVGQSLLTLQSPEYTYVAARMRDLVATFLADRPSLSVMEIGAGYGGTAGFAIRLMAGIMERYTIIDLPEMNVLQGYYLSKALGAESVALFGEPETRARVRVLPTHAMGDCPQVDILFNENSMPEIPADAVKEYMEWGAQNVTGLFFSYNHESLTSERQFAVVTVPEVLEQVPGYRRVSRTPSWVRPGYVEEVYLTGARAALPTA
jgi:hypothetical protein